MVNSMMCFPSPELTTPHGGAPFQGWRKGFGFGHSAGAGGHVLEPSLPMELRFTPAKDRGLASSPFWRRKWELGQASSFGIGDRPDYGNARDADIAPNTYGDVSPLVSKVRRSVSRPGIKLKARFPTFEEKKRDLSWPASGPGPAKYNTCIPAGQSSWSYPSKNPSWSIGAKAILQGDLREAMGKPSPSEYNCITKPGTNSPILRGTLYDISMKGRTKVAQLGEASPGPARYSVLGELDKYGLAAKIANVKIPKKKGGGMGSSLTSLSNIQENSDAEAADEEGEGDTEVTRTLMRVESSPM
eukprot:TRINITY_DN8109_c0_g1_i2.p1 TRINITY_DN8109_c0_g1~~TRINITY_DN8109_c0_g1_i2.p1  ORF type:complete len:301 (-),score=57.18 TRINITY_DN8109_c0_g1_i2:60-962(-)